jgi:hypothetical protein
MEVHSLPQPPAVENGAPAIQHGGAPTKVRLGEHEYPVYPQRIGYLERKLGDVFGTLLDADVQGGSIMDLLGGRAYRTLIVFIPRLMPEYEFRGYPTQEAFEAKEYDESYDKSPSFPEIEAAFRAAMRVNRLDLFGHLKALVGPELLQAVTQQAVATTITGRSSTGLPSDSSPTTESDPTSSGTTGATTDGGDEPATTDSLVSGSIQQTSD